MSGKLSRRDFLKLSVMGSGAALLAACAPQAATSTTVATSAPAAATSVPAAATSAPGAAAKKLIFSSYTWSGYDVTMNKVIDTWIAKQPAGSVEVERQYVAGDGYYDKLQTQIAAGTPPDLGIADYGRTVSYAKNGILLNITDRLKNSDLPMDKYFPAALAQYRWAKGDFSSGGAQGDYYGIPSDAQSQIFVYNKKMFDAAGVAYPTDDWTWDDMLAAAKKLTDPAKEQYGLYIKPSLIWRGPWIRATGGSLVSADFKKSALNSPATKEAITWLWDAIYTQKVGAPPPAAGANDPFVDRKVAMEIDGIWWIPDWNKGLDAGEYDLAQFPKHPKTGKRTTTVESDGWWMFKDAHEPDLAFDLLKFMASAAGQKIFTTEGYVIPSSLPEIATPWYDIKPPEHIAKALENITNDSVPVGLTYYEVGTIQSVVQPKLMEAFADGRDIATVLNEAEALMNTELDTAWAAFNA